MCKTLFFDGTKSVNEPKAWGNFTENEGQSAKVNGKMTKLERKPYFHWVLVCKLASGYLKVHGASARRSLTTGATELWLEAVGELYYVQTLLPQLYRRRNLKVRFVFELIT